MPDLIGHPSISSPASLPVSATVLRPSNPTEASLQFLEALQLARLQELPYAAQILPHAAVTELIELAHQPIQEIPVVGYDDESPVEGLEGAFKDILGLDVHMVRRLVERQQIMAFQHQLGHTQTRPLAAAEHRNPLVYVLAPEKEGREDVSEPRADIPRRYAVESAEDRLFLVQHIFLILREIAHIHIMSEPGGSAYRLQLPHNHPHKRSLALAVAPDKGHLLPSLDLYVRIGEHQFSGIAYRQIFSLIDHIPGALCRRKLHAHRAPVRLVHLYALHFLQSLDSGLHLIRFRGLVAEAVYEVLRLLYHLLLVLVGGGLLGHTLGTKGEILAVRHLVVVQMTQNYLHGAVRHPVEKLAVVADQQNGASVGLQIVLKPFDGLDVQMVRRLVQKEKVGGAEQNLGQFYAHIPALTEGLRETSELVGLEAQTQQHLLGLHLGRLAVAEREMVVQVVQTGYQFDIFR